MDLELKQLVTGNEQDRLLVAGKVYELNILEMGIPLY